MLNSTKLVIRIINNDEVAFKELYDLYYNDLVKFSYYYVRDRDAAEDIVQDVFFKVWITRNKLDPLKNIKTYLFKITSNFSLMVLRKKKVREKFARNKSDIIVESPENEYIRKEFDKIQSDAIFSLPPKCRTIFCLSRVDKLTYKEIATSLNISVKTVEGQMGKALRKLKAILEKHL